MGYKPDYADAQVWVNLVGLTPVIVGALIPCAAAVFFGRRAHESGDHRGRFPLVIGVIAGVAMVVLTIVSEVGNIVRR